MFIKGVIYAQQILIYVVTQALVKDRAVYWHIYVETSYIIKYM